MIVEPAGTPDLASIHVLLRSAKLPSVDIRHAHLSHFRVVRTRGCADVIGVVGLEPYPPVGLLRSLAVAPTQRGAGIGATLVAAIEVLAHSQGIDELVLLTTTAERFFERLGYRKAARTGVPASLQSTSEFAELCPASAICMIKNIQA